MPSFKCAYVREQGVDMIIVPLDSSFGRMSDVDQQSQINTMQLAARSAGLAGIIVPTWMVGDRPVFMPPTNWTPFFESISWSTVLSSLNKEISW